MNSGGFMNKSYTRKKIRFYKCDVLECGNKVYTAGAICPQCLEKLINPLWYFTYCEICGKIIGLYDNRNLECGLFPEKANPGFCPACDPESPDNLF